MQASLFDRGEPGFDSHLGGICRQALDRDSWVDYLPRWVQGHQWLYDELAREGRWHHARRMMYERMVDVPRLTAPAPRSGPAGLLLLQIARALSLRYWAALQEISLAWYRDGSDSVAPHADEIGRHLERSVVAIVSVGAPRRFVLRPRRARPPAAGRRGFALGWGDLLVMGGCCQRDWLHGVPKVALADPRISIMFRPAVTVEGAHRLPGATPPARRAAEDLRARA